MRMLKGRIPLLLKKPSECLSGRKWLLSAEIVLALSLLIIINVKRSLKQLI